MSKGLPKVCGHKMSLTTIDNDLTPAILGNVPPMSHKWKSGGEQEKMGGKCNLDLKKRFCSVPDHSTGSELQAKKMKGAASSATNGATSRYHTRGGGVHRQVVPSAYVKRT